MDYSKRGLEKKQKQIGSTGRRAEKKLGFTAFRAVVICILLIAVVGVSAAIGGVKGIIDSAPEINVDDIAPTAFKSYMYLEDGTELLELAESGANRVEIDITEMSDALLNAFIALEDERFWEHDGIDPKGIMRAFIVGVTNGDFSEGASTITQQLLKNAVFSGGNEQSLLLKFKRKFQEQFLAIELEKELEKEEILEAYLNTINLGESCYGVESAAQMYFDKHASELNASEASVLAAIAQSPTYYNPYRYPEGNAERRKICLKHMLDQGYIDEAEYNAALAEDIYETIKVCTENYKTVNNRVTTYYEDAAISMLIEDFAEIYGYVDDPTTIGVNEADEQAKRKLYSGGYSIYLAQDPEIQQICDNYYADNSNFPTTEYLLNWALTVYNDDGTTSNYSVEMLEARLKEYYGNYSLLYKNEEAADADIALYMELEGIPDKETNYSWKTLTPQVQSSFVLMDQYTGEVKAIVGGRGVKTISRSFNRATDATRSPGSAFKVVSTYAPALDSMGLTLASTKVDSVYTAYGGHKVKNVDLYCTNRAMTYREAIIKSKNTVAVKVLAEEVTPEYALNFLQERFHFTTLTESDNVEVLALGGLTNGVTNLELTAAYASIANEGVYTKPVLYTKVIDHDGNVVIDNTVPETSVALKASTAFMLTDAMTGVVAESGGTATKIRMYNMPVAGKTGTSDDRKDLWFVGYTPYYTAGIWFGYDDSTPVSSRTSNYYGQQYLWKNIMADVIELENQERKEFEVPSDVQKISVCRETGKLATSTCSAVSTYCDINSRPTEYCAGHYVKPETEESEEGTGEEGTGTGTVTTPTTPTTPDTPTTPTTPSAPETPTTPTTPADPGVVPVG